MKPEPLLAIEGLSVAFVSDAGRAQVLDDVRLDIGNGEIVGLVGESGSGKTTIARAVLGILPANAAAIEAGRIVFEGRDLLQAPQEWLREQVRGRRITFVPQDPFTSFNPVYTIGSQIMELMRWKGGSGDTGRLSRASRSERAAQRARVIELLSSVQLPDPEALLAKYPHEVSGGQRQRLMIAMALLPEPKLIIADEPTTALDVTIQAQILKLLRRLARDRGASVLFTTHDLGAAHEICDRITVLYAGQMAEAATAERFFKHPAHPYTRALLDSLPRRGSAIRGIPGEVPRLISPPRGCRFHPRCGRAVAVCSEARPPTVEIEAGHQVRCVHALGTAVAPAGGVV